MWNESLKCGRSIVPVHELWYARRDEWPHALICAACSVLCVLCVPPAAIEGRCHVRFVSHDSWNSDKHEWSITSCKDVVHRHMAAVQHHAFFSALSRLALTLYRQIRLSSGLLKKLLYKNISCSCELRNIEWHCTYIGNISVMKGRSFLLHMSCRDFSKRYIAELFCNFAFSTFNTIWLFTFYEISSVFVRRK